MAVYPMELVSTITARSGFASIRTVEDQMKLVPILDRIVVPGEVITMRTRSRPDLLDQQGNPVVQQRAGGGRAVTFPGIGTSAMRPKTTSPDPAVVTSSLDNGPRAPAVSLRPPIPAGARRATIASRRNRTPAE